LVSVIIPCIGRSFLAIVAEASPQRLTSLYIHWVATIIWARVALAAGYVPVRLAREYFNEAERICTGFMVKTGPVGSLVQRLLGPFYAGYLFHCIRRGLIRLMEWPWPVGPMTTAHCYRPGLVRRMIDLLSM
jgi:hypothetical protein